MSIEKLGWTIRCRYTSMHGTIFGSTFLSHHDDHDKNSRAGSQSDQLGHSQAFRFLSISLLVLSEDLEVILDLPPFTKGFLSPLRYSYYIMEIPAAVCRLIRNIT